MKLKRFTDEDRDRIVQRYRDGETAVSLAREIGVHEGTVRGWIRSRVAYRPYSALRASEAGDAYRKTGSYAKAGKLLGVNKSTVWRAIHA